MVSCGICSRVRLRRRERLPQFQRICLCGLGLFQNTSRLRITISDTRLEAFDGSSVVGVALRKNLFEAFVRLDGILLPLADYRLEPLHFVRLAG